MSSRTIKTILAFAIFLPMPYSSAGLFGEDTAVLAKILSQSIRQLHELKRIVHATQSEINMIRNIHHGINDSLHLLKTIHPELDPGVFKDWRTSHSALKKVQALYGSVKRDVKDKALYTLNDKSVAEAISLNNNLFKNAESVDLLGDRIKSYSHSVSPGGAQKLTAQSLGVLLKVQNNSLRAQAKSLKLQAQSLARENKQDKDSAEALLGSVEEITSAFSKQQTQEKFLIPRFK